MTGESDQMNVQEETSIGESVVEKMENVKEVIKKTLSQETFSGVAKQASSSFGNCASEKNEEKNPTSTEAPASIPKTYTFLEIVKKMSISCRWWTIPISIIPTTAIAAIVHMRHGHAIEASTFVPMLVGFAALQVAGNTHNLLTDFRSGVDKVETAKDRLLADNYVSQRTLALFTLFWASIFVIFFAHAGTSSTNLTITGALGLFAAYLYSGEPCPFKYIAMGEVIIVICFGILMPVFQSFYWLDRIELDVILLLIPTSIHMNGILHSNNLRDIENDSSAGITTVAVLLGYSAGCYYYDLLMLILPHLSAAALALYFDCIGILCTCFVLPMSINLARQARGTKEELFFLTKSTARVHMIMGICTCIGLWTMPSTTVNVKALVACAVIAGLPWCADMLKKRKTE